MKPKVKIAVDYYETDRFAPPNKNWMATKWMNICCCGSEQNIIYLPKTWKQDLKDIQQTIRDYFKKQSIRFIEARGLGRSEGGEPFTLVNVLGEDGNSHLDYLDEEDVVLVQSLAIDFRSEEDARLMQVQVMIDGSYQYILTWSWGEEMKIVKTLDEALNWLIQ